MALSRDRARPIRQVVTVELRHARGPWFGLRAPLARPRRRDPWPGPLSRTSFDIPDRAPHALRMSAALKRVNLNLPAEARARLQRLAKAADVPEATYARELLLQAIERAEAAEFRQRLLASRSPERRARDRQIASALERLRG